MQEVETDHRGNPVVCIVGETLPFRLVRCRDMEGLYRRERIAAGRIARRHAHNQREYGYQNNHRAPTLAAANFEMA